MRWSKSQVIDSAQTVNTCISHNREEKLKGVYQWLEIVGPGPSANKAAVVSDKDGVCVILASLKSYCDQVQRLQNH